MGYDTIYTITITAETKERRRDIANKIIECSVFPYRYGGLKDDGDFNDPVLSFACRGWREYESRDLEGRWLWEDMGGSLRERGINLMDGESILLYGEGEDDQDIYRTLATKNHIMQQRAEVTFRVHTIPCPTLEDYDEDEKNDKDFRPCEGCSCCGTKIAKFSSLGMPEEEKKY